MFYPLDGGGGGGSGREVGDQVFGESDLDDSGIHSDLVEEEATFKL